MIKKIFATLIVLSSAVAASFATYSTSEDSSWTTVYPGDFNFTANYSDGKVAMTWNKFTVPSGKSFLYYKVIRSQKTDNPVYPDHGYIKYDSNLDFTSYTDEKPWRVSTYYRVCAILDGKIRYCSNVVKVAIAKTTSSDDTDDETEKKEEKKEVKKETKKTSSSSDSLSSDTKKQLDEIATAFLAKVNAKYGTSGDSRTQFLTNIILKLNTLGKSNSKMKATISYLVSKLQPTTSSLDEIKNILTVE